ncbi:MAG: hypothetical protein COT81_00155 [Candidatus Buchananbacteria bacterium CG10_big_fil_rev_8_21_14_0_10_42_9]|uniref:Major facilitator superfamily (MFS) profile domain-containing protein n=1 Tax=Candidatus Buchananbacteria bacterium CG10_big_fil_rev_8_21_14_0_10_42_9 TaxID=1974526 RepID=A0A2H0W2S5_9BACT|nr:MAG: hypothetical protein COT81_00155 [Candidatus Buchananbacteria bacterium CG10_big_fil_rev_8_21_14_0_10_42_9]
MSIILFLIITVVSAVIYWATWANVLLNVNPEGSLVGVILFFISLFLALIGTLFLIIFAIRLRRKTGRIVIAKFRNSWRQATMISILVVGLLIFNSQGLFTWWSALLAVLIITILETVFASLKRDFG